MQTVTSWIRTGARTAVVITHRVVCDGCAESSRARHDAEQRAVDAERDRRRALAIAEHAQTEADSLRSQVLRLEAPHLRRAVDALRPVVQVGR